ncbi:glycosyltransferase family 25 protein [Comamonas sp. GB3 AK4-5]|uniref:glycosyltransferase family 25 protein n=1 Tax=Comamonas sp. GB3 AK4-5 TaxID=3231487 RepID=UPI00351F15FD
MPSLPIVYINLAKDTERQARMASQMLQMGLAATRLPAVWWADLPAEIQERHHSAPLTQSQYFKPLGNGEKGCYSSHMAAWRQLLASDAPAMVVFEDDVRLLPTLPQALQAIEQLPPERWDLIKLFGRAQEKVASRRPLPSTVLELITYRRVPSFAAGYVVSRSGAQKMLDSRVPFGRPVDVDMRFWFENGLRVFGVHPSVIALDDTSEVSSIWQQREGPLQFSQRLRKLRMKWQLTWGNARAKPPQAADIC